MRTEYYDCFLAVMKHKNFSKAAESLYISPSALSKMIKALEDQLGGSLFTRKGKNQVALSPFGKYLSSYISTIAHDIHLLQAATREFKASQEELLFIATFPQIAFTNLLESIITFKKKNARLQIKALETNHPELNSILAHSQTEICFAYSDFIRSPIDFNVIPLHKDPLVLISNTARAQKQKWKDSIYFGDLKKEFFIFPKDDMPLYYYLVEACKTAGFAPNIDAYSDIRYSTIAQYVQADFCCTIAPESIAKRIFFQNYFQITKIKDAPNLSLCMYVDSLHTKKIKTRFIEFIHENTKQ